MNDDLQISGEQILKQIDEANNEELEILAKNDPAKISFAIECKSIQIQKLLVQMEKLSFMLAYNAIKHNNNLKN